MYFGVPFNIYSWVSLSHTVRLVQNANLVCASLESFVIFFFLVCYMQEWLILFSGVPSSVFLLCLPWFGCFPLKFSLYSYLDRGEIKWQDDGKKLHNEELHSLYSLLSMIRMVKLRRMKWAQHVAWMGYKRNAYRSLVGKPKGRDQYEGQHIGGCIILIWIFVN
jgi:hypothetical protein